MKTIRICVLTAALTLLGATSVVGQSGWDVFQQARVLEQAEGKLWEAIQVYERIAEEFVGDRELVATALVQAGRCYEKLGRGEAGAAYRHVLEEYADQAAMVAVARERLAALRRPPESAEERSVVVRNVWGGELGDGPDDGPDDSGGPSPDGRRLVYVDWRTGDIAVRDLVTGESRRLTDGGGFGADRRRYSVGGRFSPDGEWVAYSWLQDDLGTMELRVVSSRGSAPRVVYADPDWYLDLTWSSDGSHVVVTRRADDDAVELLAVSVEDGSVRLLKRFGQFFTSTLAPSPDDRYLAVEVPSDGNLTSRDVALVATDGSGELIPVVTHPADDRVVGWLPGTPHLLFSSDRSGARDLWAVEIASGRAVRAPRSVHRGVGDLSALGFTADGSLFYSAGTSNFNTFVAPFEVETGAVALDSARPLLGSRIEADWSRDGRTLALVRQERVEVPPWRRQFLGTLDLETGVERRLADNVDLDYHSPLWSPDGRSLLVVGVDWTAPPPGRSALWRVDVESGDAVAIVTVPAVDSYPRPGLGAAWTHDGRGVVYAHGGRVALRDLATGRERELYRDGRVAARLLAPSRDGDWLAVGVSDSNELPPGTFSRITDRGRILLVPMAGGEPRELGTIERSGKITDIEWTPSGRHIIFALSEADGTTLLRVPRDGGPPEELWSTAEPLGYLTLDATGERVAYTVVENELSIWVIENLAAVLSERR